MNEGMTKEEAIKLLVNATYSDEWQGNEDLTTAHNMAIEALEMVEEFEKAQIITGGRLNGRTYAYKCGLEDGKRKALEQEPSENCVSRKAVLEMIEQIHDAGGFIGYSTYSKAFDVVDNMPSVTPTQRWIPVSERLPSDGKYLVTRGDVIGRPMIGMRYFSKDLSKVDEFDFVDKKGISGWCEYDSEYGWYIDDKVTAWMPLPEKYKAEMESEK